MQSEKEENWYADLTIWKKKEYFREFLLKYLVDWNKKCNFAAFFRNKDINHFKNNNQNEEVQL